MVKRRSEYVANRTVGRKSPTTRRLRQPPSAPPARPAHDPDGTPTRAPRPPTAAAAPRPGSDRTRTGSACGNGSRWRVDRARHVAGQDDPLPLRRRVRHRHRRQQRARIGMVRAGEQRAPVRQLDDLAEIHHRHAVRQVLDDGQVVADEQQRQAQLILQIDQQVDDLRLHRHVQRGDRLVADDQVGAGGQGAGDADALALAAGEFVRIAADRIARQLHLVHQQLDAFGQLAAAAHDAEIDQRLGQDVAHLHARVQRGERVLEHHLHAPPQRPQLPGRQVVDALAVQIDFAVGDRIEPQDRLADGGLAAAGLAHQRQGFAAVDRERHAVHRVDLRGLLPQHTAVDREVLLQAVDLEQRYLSIPQRAAHAAIRRSA